MKHYVVRLSEEQADRIRWDGLQISMEFAVELEPDGSVYVHDERRFVSARLKNPQWLEEEGVGELLAPEAQQGDEITLVFPDGSEKTFELPDYRRGYSWHPLLETPIGQGVETKTAAQPEAAQNNFIMDFKVKSYKIKLGREALRKLGASGEIVKGKGNSLILVLEDGELKIDQWPGERAMAWCEEIALMVYEKK
jgi:hypothetical protein